jgi:hypothetical protein
MAKRGGAIHVATTRRKYKGKVYESHLLRRSIRDGKKVRHETVGNLSHLPVHIIEIIRRALKGETFVCADESFECIRSLPHGHVAAVLGTLRKLGLDRIIASRRTRARDLVLAMIVARIIDPRSKLAMARGLAEDTAFSTLAETLDAVSASEDELYAAMDWLVPRQEAIEERLAKRHLAEGTLVLYDITSSYFEGRTCPLARLGHNRDGRKGKRQIVIGLLCAPAGQPVAVEVFEGNTGDPTTVASQVAKIRERFGLADVVLVGDRGMITSARIREDLAPVDGLRWITALRAPVIRTLLKRGAIERSLFDEVDLAEITSEDFPDERLIVCRNPLLAAERARKRGELLEATERELDKVVAATKRKTRPLRGADKIGLRVGKVRNKYKVGKHFDLEITETSFRYSRKGEQIEEEAALDGLYVIRDERPEGDSRGDGDGARLQEPLGGGTGLPQHEDHGSEGPSDPPPPGHASPVPRLPLHARLLRGVAHAPGPRPSPLRRSRARGGRGGASVHRGPRTAVRRSPGQGRNQDRRGRLSGPQLPDAPR